MDAEFRDGSASTVSTLIELPGGLSGLSLTELPPGVRAVFAGRAPANAAGNLSLSGGRDRAAALRVRAAWSHALGVAPADWVCGALVHGAVVRVIGAAERGRGALDAATVLSACDGLITATPGLPLYLPVADCAAVLLHRGGLHPRLGVLHAGWRGLASGILGEGVRRLRESGAEEDAPLTAWISPCARAPAYEVGAEVAERAPEEARQQTRGRWSVDIGRWCAVALRTAGLPPAHIHDEGYDTLSEERWFSHRREGVEGGRNGLIAVLTPTEDLSGRRPSSPR